MGLDTFARLDKLPAPHTDFVDVNLCGSMFTDGCSAFRGKVYNSFIEWVTGDEKTLYEEMLGYEDVKEIRNQLALFFVENKDDKKAQLILDTVHNNGQIDYPITVDEVRNLLKFFDICVEKGYTVHGWW